MSEPNTTLLDTATVQNWLDQMSSQIIQLMDAKTPVALIGIRRGGVDIGKRLLNRIQAQGIDVEEQLGELNIAFYRDDFSSIGLHPVVGPSQVPFDVENKHIVLIDDVLGTGRTVRAAMNEIFDYGRPARISLAVLIQRTGHELPIRADVIGKSLDVADNQYIVLNPEKLQVSIGEKP